jgi:hypothetical protein
MWAPRVARATSNRYSTSCHTLWRISWSVFAQTSLIRVLSSCSVVGSGGVIHIVLHKTPQKEIHRCQIRRSRRPLHMASTPDPTITKMIVQVRPHLAEPWLRLLVANLSRRRPGFAPGQYMWDLWWTKWHWDRFFSEFFRFPLSVYHSTVAL